MKPCDLRLSCVGRRLCHQIGYCALRIRRDRFTLLRVRTVRRSSAISLQYLSLSFQYIRRAVVTIDQRRRRPAPRISSCSAARCVNIGRVRPAAFARKIVSRSVYPSVSRARCPCDVTQIPLSLFPALAAAAAAQVTAVSIDAASPASCGCCANLWQRMRDESRHYRCQRC